MLILLLLVVFSNDDIEEEEERSPAASCPSPGVEVVEEKVLYTDTTAAVVDRSSGLDEAAANAVSIIVSSINTSSRSAVFIVDGDSIVDKDASTSMMIIVYYLHTTYKNMSRIPFSASCPLLGKAKQQNVMQQ